MQNLKLPVLALFMAAATASHAELVQSQPLATPAEPVSLVSGFLDNQTDVQNTASANATTKVVALASTDAAATANADGMLDRISTAATKAVRSFNQSGIASWYGRQFHGRKTANGERFDMNAMTAAHRSLPLACFIKVTNQDNGKSVIVKVNDRGPFHTNRILDLSYGAASKLGITSRGTGNVTIERVSGPAAN